MNSKIFLLTVAIAAVGLVAMPSSLSLFAGQHTFDKGANVSCEKCHQDIYDEMSGSGLYGNSSAHQSPDLRVCTGCHKTGDISDIPVGKNASGNGYNYSGTFSQNVGEKGAHAAVTMECVNCHIGVPAELLNVSEAHGPFYNESITNSTAQSGAKNNGTVLKGANEACVGCHTHTNIKASWRRSVGMDLLVYEDSAGVYNVSIAANTSYNETRTWGGNVTADGP